MGLDDFSAIEIGIMVFILLAFLGFFTMFLLLRKRQRDGKLQSFIKKQRQMEEAVVLVEERKISHRRDQLKRAEERVSEMV
ncbi:MAG: hypothetical protein IJY09_00930 [Lachnospiraceae bacterium]|nr:hypothetical protein [Lachnospiraceae bacterium]